MFKNLSVLAAGMLLGTAAHATTLASTSATTTYHRATVDGVGIFYREAGPRNAPTIVLLHGFPSSSRQFDALIPLLATRYHLIAPEEWLRSGRIFPVWWDWNTFQPFSTELHQALGQALWNGRAAMVVTGNLMWREARRKRDAAMQPRAARNVARVTVGVCVGTCVGLFFTNRGGQSLDQYFLSWRQLPWRLAGSPTLASSPRVVRNASSAGADTSMKSRTPARNAASVHSGCASEPSATIGNPG